jgi:hypothetical protein
MLNDGTLMQPLTLYAQCWTQHSSLTSTIELTGAFTHWPFETVHLKDMSPQEKNCDPQESCE